MITNRTMFEEVAMAEKERPQRTTELGQPIDVCMSALQKSIRAGREREACYWALLLYRSAPGLAWRRVLTCAAEDIGVAAPEIVTAVGVLHHMSLGAFSQKASHFLILSVMLLSRSKKSCEAEDLQSLLLEEIREGVKYPIRPEFEDGHTESGRRRGARWDAWYRVRHETIPVNEYTKELWRLRPEWDPEKLL